AEFVADGATLRNGNILKADLIVLATGYQSQEALVGKLFGEAVAARVGPIWGFGDGQELRNMFMRTPQPGLWFIGGSFAQCSIYSKYLALQIKASEEGLLSLQKGRPGQTDPWRPCRPSGVRPEVSVVRGAAGAWEGLRRRREGEAT